MEQRIYGRTGFSVSPLCIGTSSWGRPKGEESQADADVRIAEIAQIGREHLRTTVTSTQRRLPGGR